MLQISNEKIKEEIIDIHMNELIKEEKSMHIFQKHSNHFIFQIDKKIKNLDGHYKFKKGTNEVKKTSDKGTMFYSTSPIPESGIYYLKIKVV